MKNVIYREVTFDSFPLTVERSNILTRSAQDVKLERDKRKVVPTHIMLTVPDKHIISVRLDVLLAPISFVIPDYTKGEFKTKEILLESGNHVLDYSLVNTELEYVEISRGNIVYTLTLFSIQDILFDGNYTLERIVEPVIVHHNDAPKTKTFSLLSNKLKGIT